MFANKIQSNRKNKFQNLNNNKNVNRNKSYQFNKVQIMNNKSQFQNYNLLNIYPKNKIIEEFNVLLLLSKI